MKTMGEKSYSARWMQTDEMYVVVPDRSSPERKWWSRDGDNWTDGCGRPLRSAEFAAATIRLIGGPRDGEQVS